MLIKKIAVGNRQEAFIEDQFSDGLNIISSDDNNKGKTIVMQSMMYALGNESSFPATFEYKKYYYYIDFSVDEEEYQICRLGNSFIIKHDDEFALMENVSEFKRYWNKDIFPLPEISKNGIMRIVEPVLFVQVFFVGQDGKDTSNIAHTGFYNKKDYMEMVYNLNGIGGDKLNIDEIDEIKREIKTLKNDNRQLKKKHRILSSKDGGARYLSSISDRRQFEEKVKQIEAISEEIKVMITERNGEAKRRSKWDRAIKDLNSLNRGIDSGELRCMNCNSTDIAFALSSNRNSYVFDVSTSEMRTDIIISIKGKIETCTEEIEKYTEMIKRKQEALKELIREDDISLESIIAIKDKYFSAEDTEKQISDTEKKITELEKRLEESQQASEENTEKRDSMFTELLEVMNDVYKRIDPTGTLIFDDLFTKKGIVYSGSETILFYIAKLYALQRVLQHNWPIIIDSFRAEDLSSDKEDRVLEVFKTLSNQIILTTTLKREELGKYDDKQDINHIDYQHHNPSKLLDASYCADFESLIKTFQIEMYD